MKERANGQSGSRAIGYRRAFGFSFPIARLPACPFARVFACIA